MNVTKAPATILTEADVEQIIKAVIFQMNATDNNGEHIHPATNFLPLLDKLEDIRYGN